ncbi:endonuclease III [Candidatus Methylomirabilis lanthanidiphila]|uniref:Endonuclease III n=1 Tax=Candidatus Methylomirabilis lanthanidiphila TaxID=2211376 RepID=A0A564ZJY5_9BACT|nr:endonuclease III [Candidatus Methylomirabilis lanthanidiphila]
MLTNRQITKVLQQVRNAISAWEPAVVGKIAEESRDPFRVLISCILSQQTKDHVTGEASERLYRLADRPDAILALSERQIAQAIYPVSFYKTKARTLRTVCHDLLTRFGGRAPDTIETLLTLPGVGRKTANLVVTVGYGKFGICVDTHVHRISNRWGYVDTKTPEQTEMALRLKLPRRHWIYYNDLLVPFGQHLCRPISPFCSRCPVERWCAKVGVTAHR